MGARHILANDVLFAVLSVGLHLSVEMHQYHVDIHRRKTLVQSLFSLNMNDCEGVTRVMNVKMYSCSSRASNGLLRAYSTSLLHRVSTRPSINGLHMEVSWRLSVDL